MDLFLHQVVVVTLLLCVRLALGLSPLFCCRRIFSEQSHWLDLTLALGLSLAGGVLLATCFMHLVPQVRAAMHYFLPNHSLPITELLFVAGFYFTFLMDETVISLRPRLKIHPEIDTLPQPEVSLVKPPHRLMVVIMALHSYAKGVAVGLAETAGDLWFLFVATAVHESVAMVGLTLYLLKAEDPLTVVVGVSIVLAFVMVVGVVTGTVLVVSGVDAVLIGVARGLAAGNILYVIFYELLTRDTRVRALGLLSYFTALMGFLLMLALQLLGLHENKYMVSSRSCIEETTEEPDYSYPEGSQVDRQ